MNFWAVNTLLFSNTIPDSVVLGKFRRPRSPSVEPGDKIVLFARVSDTIMFLASAEVSEVFEKPKESTVQEDEGRLAIDYIANIINVEPLSTPPSLSDYRFSLTKVYRLSEPERHFRRRYVKLHILDFETIASMQIKATRTSVGILAEVLTLSDRLALASDFIGTWQDNFKEASHTILLSDLLSYVKRNYIEIALLLTSIAEETLPLRKQSIIEGVYADTLGGQRLDLLQLADSAEAIHRGFLIEGESPFEALAHQDDIVSQKSDFAFKLSVEEILRILQVI